jgi:hypothetical protein
VSIVIQDGSSFAIKPTLATTFPGRFTTIEPAAVEVHATSSGFANDVSLAHATQQVGDGTAISTRRAAMCAHHVFDDLVAALLIGVGLLRALRRSLLYLLANARRSNPKRDRRTGRLRVALLMTKAAQGITYELFLLSIPLQLPRQSVALLVLSGQNVSLM